MKMPSKFVGIIGRNFTSVIKGTKGHKVSVESVKILNLISITNNGDDTILKFSALNTGRVLVKVTVGEDEYDIPAVVFNEREFFFCLTVTSNYHVGFDPENYIIGLGEAGKIPEGHAYRKVCRTLVEPHYHALGLPVTWIVDGTVAFVMKDDIAKWHTEFYDDFGIMPPSYIHLNNRNYSRDVKQDDLTSYLRAQKNIVEEEVGWYTEVGGIDQFVGSVDDAVVRSFEEIGIKGVWGIGFDHFECDTSMYHRGCPWDCYKINTDNIRIPAKNPTDMWMFQWTQRDLINTMKTPTGPSGSVMFSTDADDIRTDKIMYHQKDYYNKMLTAYYDNFNAHSDNDFGVFLVHQEDHDTGFEDNNQYLGNFLRNITEPVTYATINEITAWLNLKYSADEHPIQTCLAKDCITCKDEVEFWDSIKKPDDWGTYPDHIFYYDRDVQVAAVSGKRLPCRVFDYEANTKIKFGEVYPEKELPNAEIISEELKDGNYTAVIRSDRDCQALPLVIEYADSDGDRHCKVNRVDIKADEQTICIPLDAEKLL